jgi:hypothetical protein
MRKRRTLLAAGAVLCFGIVGWHLPWSTPPKPGVTRENFQRLHKGMADDAVQSILGAAGEYSVGLMKRNPWLAYVREWRGQEVAILVAFDSDGLVLEGGLVDSQDHRELLPDNESLLDHLRRLLPW